MKDFTTTSFGLVIAYLLPGLVGLLAFGAWSAQVRQMFRLVAAAQGDAALLIVMGGFALVIGLILNVFRWLIFEQIVCTKYRIGPGLFASLRDEHRLQTFLMVIEETFRYHQFFGSISILTPLLCLSWLQWLSPASPDKLLMVFAIIFMFTEFVLMILWYELRCNPCEARWVSRLESKRWPRNLICLSVLVTLLVFGLALRIHFGDLKGKYYLLLMITLFVTIGIALGANAIASQRRYFERGNSLAEGDKHD